MRKIVPVLSILCMSATPVLATDYDIDPSHTNAQFSVRHMMVSNVRGEFAKVSGKVTYDPANPSASSVDASIDATSINTREEKRDKHLKSPEFLDTDKFPALTFKSKKVEAAGAGKLKVTGDLTIHGVTKEVVLDVNGPTEEVKDPWGNTRRGASATAKLNRKDYGMVWNKVLETGGLLVGEDVEVTIDLEMVKLADKPKA